MLALSWEAGSAPGEEAGTGISCCLCVQLVLHPHSVIRNCSQNGFWGSRCQDQSALRALGHQDRGREGFAQPRILSWECPEAPLRTQRIPLNMWHLWDPATSSTKQLLRGILLTFLYSKFHHLTQFLLSDYSIVYYTIKPTKP